VRLRFQAKLRLLGLLPVAGVGLASALVVVLVLDALMPVLASVAAGLVVGEVPAVIDQGAGSPAAGRALVWLGLLSAALVAQRASTPIREAMTNRVARAIDLRLRERVMRATLGPATIEHLEDPTTLDVIELSRGVSAWSGSPGRAVAGLASILSARLSGIAALVVLARFRWWAPALLGAVAGVVVLAKQRLYVQMSTGVTSNVEGLRRARYLRGLLVTPEPAREVRVFGLDGWFIGRFDAAWRGAMSDVWRARGRSAPAVLVSMLFRGAAALATVAAVARAAVRGEISLASAVVFAQAVDTSAVLSFTLGSPEILVEQGMAASTSVAALEERLHVADSGDAGHKSAAGVPASAIRFESVGFRYPGQPTAVFDGLDLEIHAGRSLAIVGANGAGKTTIVKLLTGLHNPDSGAVTVDGVDLRDLATDSWHERIAAIFQDFGRFPLPARDNVAWGGIGVGVDSTVLEEVAADAGILDEIERLPRGWDTPLTRQFSGGVDLSGGQWQRVALARALYAVRAGATVLVLDEPTAHLDVRAEAQLYERFLDLTKGLTTIVISHRFSTVRQADRIVVIERGAVIEDGSHDELVAVGGRYASMFAVQAARFSDEVDDVDA
jgi:ATP-binding cassette subfamily B protein